MRPSREELYLQIASLISRRGTCLRKQVGCVITQNNRIVSTGYNGPLANYKTTCEGNCNQELRCQESVHAELNAIAHAAKRGISLNKSTLYCTTAPCKNCAMVIIQTGIKRVFYLEEYTDVQGVKLLNDYRIPTLVWNVPHATK
jgi:dCMP deaminase